MYDLALEGGTLVSGNGQLRTNIYVQDGVIASLDADRHQARQTHDVTDLVILPGMIDGHVHFQDPGDTTREDFVSGSSAAAAGGVTTVIEHTHSHPVRDAILLREKIAHLKDRSIIDYGLAAHLWPEDLSRIEELWQLGVQFFKVFTCTTHGVPAVLAGAMLELFQTIARIDALCLVHCEDEYITARNEARLKEMGRTDYGILSEWRSREAEQVAVVMVTLLARLTGARTVVAHVSHPDVIDLISRDQRAGAALWIETCPQYLYLNEDDILKHGPYRKFTPPARSKQEAEGLWKAIAGGKINHISTDHAPSTCSQKEEGDIWQCHFGLPGVQTTLTMLLEAVHAGRLNLQRVVQLTAEAPAQIYRLWPRKGHLQPGADADMVLIDMNQTRRLSKEMMLSKSGWTPYEGVTVRGHPVATYVRGNLVAMEGRIVANPGSGHFLPGPGAGGIQE